MLQNLQAPPDLGLGDAARDLVEGTGLVGVCLEERTARLPAGVRLDGDASQDLLLQLPGHPISAVAAEDPHLLAAVRADGVAHVLHDAHELEVRLNGHLSGLDRHPRGVGLRGGHDEGLGLGDHLRHGERHVARSGRHVHDDEVGLVPVHVAHQLRQGLVDDGRPPDDGLPLVDEVAHGDELEPLQGLHREDDAPPTFGFWSDPSMTGTEDPCTSASSISTEWPALSSAAARFTATVLLPTPPLPETTAITRVFDSSLKAGASSAGPPCSEVIRFCRSASLITPKSTSTLSTPSICMSLSLTSVVMRCFKGHPAVVSATPTVTATPSIFTPRTMFSETRSRPISGSRTSRNASRMPASESPSGGWLAPPSAVSFDGAVSSSPFACRRVHLLIFM